MLPLSSARITISWACCWTPACWCVFLALVALRRRSARFLTLVQARVPSLIQGVKDFGLVVGTYGLLEDLERLPTSAGAEANGVDAALHDGVLTYFNHRPRGTQGL